LPRQARRNVCRAPAFAPATAALGPQVAAHHLETNGRIGFLERSGSLDKVEPASGDPGDGGTDPEEAAWRTAVDAAPWLVGESEPHEDVPPEELYDKLKPFKDRVAEDIKDGE
jgi:hypothetical protein